MNPRLRTAARRVAAASSGGERCGSSTRAPYVAWPPCTAIGLPLLPTLLLAALLLALTPPPATAQVLITEFMAANQRTLADDFGQFEDWIELQNAGHLPVNLDGWSLTDNPLDLSEWRFPAVQLPAGGYLVVFASNRDRRDPTAPLHTSFRLKSTGQFLALVDPAGAVVSQFAPRYPAQVPDVSFGLGQELRFTTNLTRIAPGRLFIPDSGSLGTHWIQPEFDDSTWARATNGIGFDTRVSELNFGGAALAVLDARPVAYWRLSETNGPSAANQGSLGPTVALGSYGGVTFGAAGPRPNPFDGFEPDNHAIAVNGRDGRLETPYHPGLNPAIFSFACWARVTGAPGTYRSPVTCRVGQAGEQAGFLFYATPGDTWQLWTGSGNSWNVLAAGPVVYNQWIHLAGTYDGTTLCFYTNGVYAAGEEFAFRPNNRYPLRIGAGATEGTGDYFFAGNVDEVAVFDRALAAQEIRRQFQAATNAAGSGPVTNTGPSHFAGLIATDLETSMAGRPTGAYLRLPFVLTNLAGIDRLVLRVQYDDGFVAYLNGFEAAAANAPAALAWNSVATARRDNADAVVFEEFNLVDALPWLRLGTNVLALHGLNFSPTNTDFLLRIELESTSVLALGTNAGYFIHPTPGTPNDTANAVLGPLIRDVVHRPLAPLETDPLVVTARVLPVFAPPAPGGVVLHYRVMFGVTNTVPMFDDGQHDDGAPGDAAYAAILPAGLARPGQMLRWYVTAADTLGRSSRWPLFPDPLRSPEYLGTVVRDPTLATNLPTFAWFAANPAAGRTRTGTRCAVSYRDRLYDNVFVRERGGFTSYGSQKFDFNPGDFLDAGPGIGEVEEVNINSNGSDPSFIRQPLAFAAFSLAGSDASDAFLVRLRLNGAPDRTGIFIEQVDERFLDRRGFDRQGALYKFTQRSTLTPVLSDVLDGVEKKTRRDEDHSDLQEVVDGLALARTPAQRTAFILDRFSLPQVINYLAERVVIEDVDSVRKNFYLHCDTRNTREWSIFPWDKDWSFAIAGGAGPNAAHPFLGTQAYLLDPPNHQWSLLFESFFNLPAARQMYLRRLRTLMDRQLGPPGTLNGPLEQLAAALMQRAAPDLGRGVTNALAGVLGYFPQRRTDLYVTYAATNTAAGVSALIPSAQPTNAVVGILAFEFNPPSGNQDEEYICITNANAFAVDVSGWTLEGGVRFQCRPGTVIPAGSPLFLSPDVAAFRRRLTGPRGGQGLFVQGPYEGRLSAWGESVALHDDTGRLVSSNAFVGQPSAAQRFLRITAIQYNPAPEPGDPFDPQQSEFVELRNIAPDLSLDLGGVRFTRGIDFTFASGAVQHLAPGQRVVVARNPAAFTRRHGSDLALAGTFTGALDNAGESIRLEDATGEKILEFAYDPGWHPMTDGLGASLVAVDDHAPWFTWGNMANWRSSIPNERPSVEWLSPVPGSTSPPSTPLVLEAAAVDPDDPVVRLEFWDGQTRLAALTGPPYRWSWTNAPFGPHQLRAVAFDARGLRGESVPVTVTVLSSPPTVAWLSPAIGTVAAAGDSLLLAVAATDPDSPVAAVDFSLDDTPIATVGAPPFRLDWIAVPGTHTLYARARDESGPGPTAAMRVAVQAVLTNTTVLVPAGSRWRYLDDGSNPGTNWMAPAFNDAGWSNNLAELGYGDRPNGRPEATEIRFGPDPNNKHVTYHFRHAFTLPIAPPIDAATFEVLRDDGAIAWLNGREIFRDNLPAGPVNYLTLATNAIDDGTVFYPQRFDPALLSTGANLLAVEVHQSSRGSSDVSFDARLSVRTRTLGPAIVREPVDQIVPPGGQARFDIEATGTSPLTVGWRFNGNLMPGATSPVLTLTPVQRRQAGLYSAIVTNLAGAVASATARLIVPAPTPAVAAVVPSAPGAGFTLTLPSVTGFTYHLESAPDLARPSWQPVLPGVPGDGTVLQLTDPAPPAHERYYRVRID